MADTPINPFLDPKAFREQRQAALLEEAAKKAAENPENLPRIERVLGRLVDRVTSRLTGAFKSAVRESVPPGVAASQAVNQARMVEDVRRIAEQARAIQSVGPASVPGYSGLERRSASRDARPTPELDRAFAYLRRDMAAAAERIARAQSQPAPLPPGAASRAAQIAAASAPRAELPAPFREQRVYQVPIGDARYERRRQPRAGTPLKMDDLVAIDIETTGLDLNKSQIISVGIKRKGQPPKTLIATPTVPIEASASQTNRFEMRQGQLFFENEVVKNPLTQDQLKAALLKEIAGATAVVTHNGLKFDIPILVRYGFPKNLPVIDTHSLMRNRLSDEFSNLKLTGTQVGFFGGQAKTVIPGVYQQLTGRTPSGAHHAGADAEMAYEILEPLLKKIGVRDLREAVAQSVPIPGVPVDPRGLLELQRDAQGAVRPALGFGRFYGTPLSKLFDTREGDRYAKLILQESKTPEGTYFDTSEDFRGIVAAARRQAQEGTLSDQSVQDLLANAYPRNFAQALRASEGLPLLPPPPAIPASGGGGWRDGGGSRPDASRTLFPSEYAGLQRPWRDGGGGITPGQAKYLLEALGNGTLGLHNPGDQDQVRRILEARNADRTPLKALDIESRLRDLRVGGSRDGFVLPPQDIAAEILGQHEQGLYTGLDATRRFDEMVRVARLLSKRTNPIDRPGSVQAILEHAAGNIYRLNNPDIVPLLDQYAVPDRIAPHKPLTTDQITRANVEGFGHLTLEDARLLYRQLEQGQAVLAGKGISDPLHLRKRFTTLDAAMLADTANRVGRYALTGLVPGADPTDARQGIARIPMESLRNVLTQTFGAAPTDRTMLRFLSGLQPFGGHGKADLGALTEGSSGRWTTLPLSERQQEMLADPETDKIVAQVRAEMEAELLTTTGSQTEAQRQEALKALQLRGAGSVAWRVNALQRPAKKDQLNALHVLQNTGLSTFDNLVPEDLIPLALATSRGESEDISRYLQRSIAPGDAQAGAGAVASFLERTREGLKAGQSLPNTALLQESTLLRVLAELGFQPDVEGAPAAGAYQILSHARELQARVATAEHKAAGHHGVAVDQELQEATTALGRVVKSWEGFLNQHPNIKNLFATGDAARLAISSGRVDSTISAMVTLADIFQERLAASQAVGMQVRPLLATNADSIIAEVARAMAADYDQQVRSSLAHFVSTSSAMNAMGQMRGLNFPELQETLRQIPIGSQQLLSPGPAIEAAIDKLLGKSAQGQSVLDPALREQLVALRESPNLKNLKLAPLPEIGTYLERMEAHSEALFAGMDDQARLNTLSAAFAQLSTLPREQLINQGRSINALALASNQTGSKALVALASQIANPSDQLPTPRRAPLIAGLPKGKGLVRYTGLTDDTRGVRDVVASLQGAGADANPILVFEGEDRDPNARQRGAGGGRGGRGGPPKGPRGPAEFNSEDDFYRRYNSQFQPDLFGVQANLSSPVALQRFLGGVTGDIKTAYRLDEANRRAFLDRIGASGSPNEDAVRLQATKAIEGNTRKQTTNLAALADRLAQQGEEQLGRRFGRGFPAAVAPYLASAREYTTYANALENVRRFRGKGGQILPEANASTAFQEGAAYLEQRGINVRSSNPNLFDTEALGRAAQNKIALENKLRDTGSGFLRQYGDSLVTAGHPDRTQGFLQRFQTQLQKLWSYMAGGLIVFTIVGYLQKLGQELGVVATAAARIQGVLGGKSLGDRLSIKEDIIRSAQEFGSSLTGTAQSLQVFAQAGFGRAKAVQATRAALAAEQGAGIDPKQATEFIIASNALFEGKADMFRLVDKLSRVESTRAISAQDLSVIQQRVGSLAKELQPDQVGRIRFDDLLAGAGTAIIEQTRVTGDVAATSLRFMLARLASPRVLNALQDRYGVKLSGSDPNSFAPLSDILQRLAARYQELKGEGSAKSTAFLATFAGARQINAAAALFDRMDEVMQVAAESSEAFGDTMRRVSLQMDTMPAQLSRLHTAFAGLINSLSGNGLIGKGAVSLLAGGANVLGKASETLLGRAGLGLALAGAAAGIAKLRNREPTLVPVAAPAPTSLDAYGNVVIGAQAPATPKVPFSQRSGYLPKLVSNAARFGSIGTGVIQGAMTALGGTLLITAILGLISVVVEYFQRQAQKTKSVLDTKELEKSEFFQNYKAFAAELNSTPGDLVKAVNRARTTALARTEEQLGYAPGTLLERFNDPKFKEPRFRATLGKQLVAALGQESPSLAAYLGGLKPAEQLEIVQKLITDTQALQSVPGQALAGTIDDAVGEAQRKALKSVESVRKVSAVLDPLGLHVGTGLYDPSYGAGKVALTEAESTLARAYVSRAEALKAGGKSSSEAAAAALYELAGVNKALGSPDQEALAAYNKRTKQRLSFTEFATTAPVGQLTPAEAALRERLTNRQVFKDSVLKSVGISSGLFTREQATQKDFSGLVGASSGGTLANFMTGIFTEVADELKAKIATGGPDAVGARELLAAFEKSTATEEQKTKITANAAKGLGRIDLRNRLVALLAENAAEQDTLTDLGAFRERRGLGGGMDIVQRQYQATLKLVESLTALPYQLKKELAVLQASEANALQLINLEDDQNIVEPTVAGTYTTADLQAAAEKRQGQLNVSQAVLQSTIAAMGGPIGDVFQGLTADSQAFILKFMGLTPEQLANKTDDERIAIIQDLIKAFENLREVAQTTADALRDKLLGFAQRTADLDVAQAARALQDRSTAAVTQTSSGMASRLAEAYGQPVALAARLAEISANRDIALRDSRRTYQDAIDRIPFILEKEGILAAGGAAIEANKQFRTENLDAVTAAETQARIAVMENRFNELMARRDRTIAAGAGLRELLGSFQNLSEAFKNGTVFQQALGPLADQLTGGTADMFVGSLVGPEGLFKNLFPFFTDPIYRGTYTGTYEGVLAAMREAGIITAEATGAGTKMSLYSGLLGAAAPGALLPLGGAVLAGGIAPGAVIPALGPGVKVDAPDPNKTPEEQRKIALQNLLKSAVNLAGQLGGAAVGGGGRGAQTGAALGTAAGSLIPIPVIGPIIGGLFGGLLGGLFDKKPEPPKPELQALELIERNTRDSVTALQNQVELMTLDDRLLNVPTTFRVPDYRPLTVGSGAPGQVPGAMNVSIVINDARDPDAVAKAVSKELRSSMRSSGLYVSTR